MFSFGTKSNHIKFVRRANKTEVQDPKQDGPKFSFGGPKFSFSGTKFGSFRDKNKSSSIFLLSDRTKFDIFELMPRLFTITTNTGSANFNTELLMDTSSVITEFLKENPNHMQYHLDINDTDNVLHKFEQLYQGEFVVFEEDELLISHKITKILNITECPNFMKPESLKTPESGGFSTNRQSNTNIFGVEMNLQNLDNYIIKTAPKTFTIETNKAQYQCNIFGVYSSNVIRKILENDPTTNKYVYNFDDEFNEFQSICDLFNFQHVTLTKNNMDSIKEIAEDLEINIILEDVAKFINTLEKVSQSIDEQETIIEPINNLFNLLYNIKTKSVESIKESILETDWPKSEDNVKELAAFIIQVILSNITLHQLIMELLIQLNQEANETNKLDILIPFITKQLMMISFQIPSRQTSGFSKPKEDALNFPVSYSNFSFIYLLYKKEFISKDELYDILRKVRINAYIKCWFLPELIELNMLNTRLNTGFGSQKTQAEKFVESYLPDRIEFYKRMRDNGEPDDELTKALRKDDCDTVQRILSNNEKDLSKCFIPFNIFENVNLNVSMSYIDYAAAYGSLKCFKFLLLNHDKITESTFSNAVFGGNIEIIKIVDQTSPSKKDKPSPKKFSFSFGNSKSSENSLNSKILPAIQKHRNELFDWIFETKYTDVKNDALEPLFISSIMNGNAHSLIQIIDRGFNYVDNKRSFIEGIQKSASNGFYLLTRFLYNLMHQDDINPASFNLNWIIYDNISIFNLFGKELSQKDYDKIFRYSIEKNLTSYIIFFLETLAKDSFKVTNESAFSSLNSSLDLQTNKTFYYLIDHFKDIDSTIFIDNPQYSQLLDKACINKNFEAAKRITEMIIDYNTSTYDFTSHFFTSLHSDAIEICNYFIEKKLLINYEKISSQIIEVGTISEEIFSLIIKNVIPETRCKILKCLNFAIEKKNVNLVKFILNEKPDCSRSLLAAAEANSLEIVELILNYNSQPSFINQIGQKGTALAIAVNNNNLKMVQKLLSIPGINPNLYGPNSETPLIIAINSFKMEMIDAILDFYGDDIQNQKWQIDQSLNNIFFHLEKHKPSMNKNNASTIETKMTVIKRLLSFNFIDHNAHFGKFTFLTYACQNNNIELVQILLKYDDIDVNLYESETGNSPLIIAVKNNYIDIAKLFIEHPHTNINQENFIEETALSYAVINENEEIIDLIIKNDKFDPVASRLDYSFWQSNGKISKKLCEVKSLDVNYGHLVFENTEHRFGMNSPKNVKTKFINMDVTSLVKAIQMNDLEKMDLIIQHPSFDKVKSQIRTAVLVSVKTNQVYSFKKLMPIADNDINIFDYKGMSILYYSILNLNEKFLLEILNNPQYDSKKNDLLNTFILAYTVFDFNKVMQPRHFDENDEYDENEHADENDEEQDDDRNNNAREDNNEADDSKSPIQLMNQICKFDESHDHLIDFTKLLPNGFSFFTSIKRSTPFDEEICKFLLEKGVDPDMPDANGLYPLEHAIQIQSTGFVTALIDSGKIDLTRHIPKTLINPGYFGEGTTYLHLAAASNKDILSIFLDKKLIDINIENADGDTPLFSAVRANKKDNIKILFDEENLDFLHTNKKGKDVLTDSLKYKQAPKTKDEYLKVLLNNKPGFTLNFKKTNDDSNSNNSTTSSTPPKSGFTFNFKKANNESNSNNSAASTKSTDEKPSNSDSLEKASPSDFEKANNESNSPNTAASTKSADENPSNSGSLGKASPFSFNKANNESNSNNSATSSTSQKSGFAFNFKKANNESNSTNFAASTKSTDGKQSNFGSFGKATPFSSNKANTSATASTTSQAQKAPIKLANESDSNKSFSDAKFGSFGKSLNKPSNESDSAPASVTSIRSRKLEFHNESFSEKPDPNFQRSLNKKLATKDRPSTNLHSPKVPRKLEKQVPRYVNESSFIAQPPLTAYEQNMMMMQQQQQWVQMIQLNNARQAQLNAQMQQNFLTQKMEQQTKKNKKRSPK